MAKTVSAFAVGLLFGIGLLVSGMANPAKVLAFLDVTGRWDPSLAFVMAGAVAVSAAGYRVARRRGRPVLAPRLDIPTRRDLDPRLLVGAAVFGLGWGLAGLCPGPALTILTVVPAPAATFVAAMVVGMLMFRLVPSSTSNPKVVQGADA
ncbi:YeeE/YedE family protein [Methylobacterium sp. NI91]|uniref:YeeE/YedE family protein n=1 Tax=Methylorubrum rhodesianum TaxID=29427 RepID=UPI00140A0E60|nr:MULTISPECIES: YeeE/YedE family protein [unclassified Methylobacterium]QIJ77469.1 YeeE/YedE family protein [Methylobacterium sp. CLZ]QIJ82372.1 YeeE/YedE family protein [Methylobacterium sp. NI91]